MKEASNADGINLVLKMQLTAICDQLRKPRNQIDVDALRNDLAAARDTLERAEKLKITIDEASINLLPPPLRIFWVDYFLQSVFASFPK